MRPHKEVTDQNVERGFPGLRLGLNDAPDQLQIIMADNWAIKTACPHKLSKDINTSHLSEIDKVKSPGTNMKN